MTNEDHKGQHIVWSQKSKFKLNKHILYFLHLELNLLEYPQDDLVILISFYDIKTVI